MHLRRIACFLLGGWLVGSVLMLFVTSWNDDAADAVLRTPSPETAKLLSTLPAEQARILVFHVANEAGRAYGTAWEAAQLVIGFVTAWALFMERRTRFYSAGIGLMIVMVLFECFIVLPQLDWIGSSVDFVSWKASSPTRDQYWNLRGVFAWLESVKLLVGGAIAAGLVFMRSRARSSRLESEEADSGGRRSPRSGPTRTSASGSGEHATRP